MRARLRQASLSAMATACFRLRTLAPEDDFSAPRLYSRITLAAFVRARPRLVAGAILPGPAPMLGGPPQGLAQAADGRPRPRWSTLSAPADSTRRLRRHTYRTVTSNAVATSCPVTRLATKGLSNPIRGASF